MFRKVAIIGIGLIGGSMGMALRKNRLAQEVVGVSRQHASLVHALKNGTVDKASHDIKKSVENADLIILATPVKTIIQLLPEIGKAAKRGCIIIDVGSSKTKIVEAAEKNIPSHAFFVGCHPLAGSEKKGALFSKLDLFQNSWCLIASTDKTNKPALEKVKLLWEKLGANTKIISPEEHDKILSFTSHLPHLLAFGLMAAIPSSYLEYAAQGLRDTTRIASSDPEMWRDICFTNSKDILKSLDEFVKILAAIRKSIVADNEQNLTEQFKKSKEKRDAIERS